LNFRAQKKLFAVHVVLLKQGTSFIKHTKGKSPTARFVCLSPGGDKIIWGADRKSALGKGKEIPLHELQEIISGLSDHFEIKSKKDVPSEKLCFTMVSSQRVLNLQAPDEQTSQAWVSSVRAVLRQFKSSTP